MALELAPDNHGNLYQLTSQKTKNNTAGVIIMELALTQHTSKCTLNLTHTYRENNERADQLTHTDTTGFLAHNRIHPDETEWHILGQLIETQATLRSHKEAQTTRRASHRRMEARRNPPMTCPHPPSPT